MLSFDEKTQVQALERAEPLLPRSFGKTEKPTHDYARHSTTNLFAAGDTFTAQGSPGAALPANEPPSSSGS